MIDWILNHKYMWGFKEEKTMDDHKNKIEELEDKIEKLENDIANIKDVLEVQDEPEMDIEYFIKEEANCTALKEYKKPLNKLNDYEQKTCIEIAERHVLGI